jgi:hypothetical protein
MNQKYLVKAVYSTQHLEKSITYTNTGIWQGRGGILMGQLS